jgi:hypothetical protein
LVEVLLLVVALVVLAVPVVVQTGSRFLVMFW